jgi:hypothetical protein
MTDADHAALGEHSLAYWRQHPIAFIEQALYDPETGQPFKLLPAERDFLTHAFKTDAYGRLLYPELIYSAPKKSGKTTLAALVVITVMVLFAGRFGEAVICANDYEQAASRVYLQVRRIIEVSPYFEPKPTSLPARSRSLVQPSLPSHPITPLPPVPIKTSASSMSCGRFRPNARDGCLMS